MKWVQLLCFSILLPCLLAEKLCYYNAVMEDDPGNQPSTKECNGANEFCFCGVGKSSSGKRTIERGCKEICAAAPAAPAATAAPAAPAEPAAPGAADTTGTVVRSTGSVPKLNYTYCDVNLCNLCPAVIGLPSGVNGLHLSMAVALVVGVVNVCMW